MIMKKTESFLCRLLLVVSVFAVVFSFPVVSFAREGDDIVRKKEFCASGAGGIVGNYNVLVLEHNPPFSWTKSYGTEGGFEVYGIGIYLLEELLNDYGIRAKRRFKSIEKREDLEFQTWNKDVDTTIGIQYYPTLDSNIRDRFLHPAYMSNPIVAVFAKGKEKKLNSSSDLAGLNGAYIVSDHIEFMFPEELYLSSVDSVREAFEKLLEGKLDYVLMGYYTANMEATKFKVTDKLVISEKPLRKVENFLTLDRSRPCGVFADDFDAKIREIVNDKVKMSNLLYRAYKEYEEQTKMFPALKVKEPEPVAVEEDF